MNLRLNKAHFPVTALGYGRRIGLWVQGCSIGCKGCLSQDTWAADGAGVLVAPDAVVDWCRTVAAGRCDGVTISGGEPFEQPEALGVLLDRLDDWRSAECLELDLLAYSGLRLHRLRRDFAHLLDRLDAVIAEPFVQRLAPGGRWLGSANQRLTPLSALGEARYGDLPAEEPDRPIQVGVDAENLWYIGVPRPGDLERLEAAARARGLNWRGASWRA